MVDYAGYSAHPVGPEQIDSDTLMAVDLYSCVLEFIVYIDWTGSHSRRMKSRISDSLREPRWGKEFKSARTMPENESVLSRKL